MPKFELPEVAENDMGMMEEAAEFPYTSPSLFIPANQEILAALEVGKEVEIRLRGKVSETVMRDKEGEQIDADFRFDVQSVEVPDTNAFTILAEEDE